MSEGWKAYLDANVFIDAIEGGEEVASPARRLLDAGRSTTGLLVTSELTLAEVLGPGRHRSMSEDVKLTYLDLIISSGIVELNPVSRAILMETARLRRLTRLKLIDAIHFATAVRANCRFLVSRDRDFSASPDGIETVTAQADALRDAIERLT
ncbi:MAG: type II toxin-antitoxin system VapC family toxin [Dongiaceae bacterium]